MLCFVVCLWFPMISVQLGSGTMKLSAAVDNWRARRSEVPVKWNSAWSAWRLFTPDSHIIDPL